MSNIELVAKLLATKERLGKVVYLDFKDEDIITVHRMLGEEVKWQVHKILTRKLSTLDQREFVNQIRLGRRCRSVIVEKLHSHRIDCRIRSALNQYLACLSAWGEGVQLDSFQHKILNNLTIDGDSISADDLAIFL